MQRFMVLLHQQPNAATSILISGLQFHQNQNTTEHNIACINNMPMLSWAKSLSYQLHFC